MLYSRRPKCKWDNGDGIFNRDAHLHIVSSRARTRCNMAARKYLISSAVFAFYAVVLTCPLSGGISKGTIDLSVTEAPTTILGAGTP